MLLFFLNIRFTRTIARSVNRSRDVGGDAPHRQCWQSLLLLPPRRAYQGPLSFSPSACFTIFFFDIFDICCFSTIWSSMLTDRDCFPRMTSLRRWPISSCRSWACATRKATHSYSPIPMRPKLDHCFLHAIYCITAA